MAILQFGPAEVTIRYQHMDPLPTLKARHILVELLLMALNQV